MALHGTGYAPQQAYAPVLAAVCSAGAAICSIRWLLSVVLLPLSAAAVLVALAPVVGSVCVQCAANIAYALLMLCAPGTQSTECR